MPKHQHTTYESKGHIRTRVTMRRGEVISLCRCWHSKNFSLCDGSQNDLDAKHGPVVIQTECDEDFLDRSDD